MVCLIQWQANEKPVSLSHENYIANCLCIGVCVCVWEREQSTMWNTILMVTVSGCRFYYTLPFPFQKRTSQAKNKITIFTSNEHVTPAFYVYKKECRRHQVYCVTISIWDQFMLPSIRYKRSEWLEGVEHLLDAI